MAKVKLKIEYCKVTGGLKWITILRTIYKNVKDVKPDGQTTKPLPNYCHLSHNVQNLTNVFIVTSLVL